MVSIEDVKTYIRVDSEDEDTMLEMFIEAADSFMADAINNYHDVYPNAGTKWQQKANLCELMLVGYWYEHRTESTQYVPASVAVLVTQLQLHNISTGGESNG